MRQLGLVLLLGFLLLPKLAEASHATPEQALRFRKQIELSERDSLRLQSESAEKIILPVSRPFHQGSTSLCWAYATLNAIETNYLVNTSGSGKKLELSRALMQYLNWEDRYTRKVLQNENYLYEGGTTVDGINIMRKKGMLALSDYAQKPKSTPAHNPFILSGNTPQEQIASLYKQLNKTYGLPSSTTHFEEQTLTSLQMVGEILEDQEWEAYAPSLNGKLGWQDHWDPDARKETLSYYLPPEEFISNIRTALLRGTALAISICGHDILLYGAEYDAAKKPLLYYIKDNYDNPFYTVKPSSMVLGQRFCGYSTLKLPHAH